MSIREKRVWVWVTAGLLTILSAYFGILVGNTEWASRIRVSVSRIIGASL